MNSEIDIRQFSSTSNVAAQGSKRLVSPPRRIFTRYVLPVVLLGGFAAVTAYSFRGALVPTIDVDVTMPVPAPARLVVLADFSAQPEIEAMHGGHGDGATALVPPESPGKAVSSAAELEREQPAIAGRGRSLFQAPGWIEPSPYPIIIPSLRPGTVETVHIIEGQQVTSGMVVARLVDDDARLAVRMHESSVRLKQAKYDAALNEWKNPTSLVESIATAKARGGQLAAQLKRQQDLAELAALEARIGSTLTQSGFEASLDTTRKETELSASRNQILETRAEIALNSATLAAAAERFDLRIEDREALETAHAELLEAQVALDTARLELARSVIYAPTSGTIMRLAVGPGAMLSGEMEDGMTIAEMYKPEMLQVRVDVPLAEAAKVRPGLPAEIRVEALPDRRFRGELVNIVPQFNLQKNVLPVKVRIYDPDPALRPEMIAKVEFFAEQKIEASPAPAPDRAEVTDDAATVVDSSSVSQTKQADEDALTDAADYLMVPSETVLTEGDRRVVRVVGPDNTVHQKTIEAAAIDNGMSVVRSGLLISDKIIIKPDEVAPGSNVRIKGVIENGTH